MTTKELLALVEKAGRLDWFSDDKAETASDACCFVWVGTDRHPVARVIVRDFGDHDAAVARAALIVAAVNSLPALCAEVEALRKDAERWRAYERELPDSADSTRGFLHGVAVLKAAKLAAKEPTK